MLGSAYYEGKGVARDSAEAYRWFSEAGKAGLAAGMHAVAVARLTGTGTTKDPASAVQILRALIAQDYPLANLTLGRSLREGLVLEPDYVEARALLRAAALAGVEGAYIRYAELAAKGIGGPVDLVEARIWIERALEAGVPGAPIIMRKLEELEAAAKER